MPNPIDALIGDLQTLLAEVGSAARQELTQTELSDFMAHVRAGLPGIVPFIRTSQFRKVLRAGHDAYKEFRTPIEGARIDKK